MPWLLLARHLHLRPSFREEPAHALHDLPIRVDLDDPRRDVEEAHREDEGRAGRRDRRFALTTPGRAGVLDS